MLLSSGAPFSHAAVEALLTENARTDLFTGEVPNEAYGFGKVDLGLALFGATYVDPLPPGISLSSIETAIVGNPLAINAVVSQPGGSIDDLDVAWDLGYDGTEEQPLAPSLRFTTTPTVAGLLRVLARAKNLITGRTRRALFAVEVIEGCDVPAARTAAAARMGCALHVRRRRTRASSKR